MRRRRLTAIGANACSRPIKAGFSDRDHGIPWGGAAIHGEAREVAR